MPNNTHKLVAACLAIAFVTTLAGCATPRGGSIIEKQSYVRHMHDDTLAELYHIRPDLRSRIESSAGYGVFSNVNIHLLILSSGHGYGLVMDNTTGHETYMRLFELGVGLGAGLKDFRAVFVFPSEVVLRTFVEKGWEFGAEAEAAATSGNAGGAAATQASTTGKTASAGTATKAGASGASSASGGIEIYRITAAGIALQATVAGTKYWPDGKLNE